MQNVVLVLINSCVDNLELRNLQANFLRTYLPDVDIPAELIRDQLTQDAKITESMKKFDPYTRNLLQPVVTRELAFLAFPMGELNCDLSMSWFVSRRNCLGQSFLYRYLPFS